MKAYTRREENEIKLFWSGFERRDNIILTALVGLGFALAKYPSIIIEVFYRKKFGERYFTLASSVFIFLLLLLISLAPKIVAFIFMFLDMQPNFDNGFDVVLFLFACAFLFKSIKQRQEISKYGVTYKLDRFSLSQGEYHKFFNDRFGQKLYGIPVNSKTIQILFEPSVPIIAGVVFLLIPYFQVLGAILLFCGVIMVIRQFGRAMQGRNAVLDIIDQNIMSQNKAGILMEEKPMEEVHGIRLPVALPTDENVRQLLFDETDTENLSKDTWTE
tara:strand:- start:8658 stop:9476 length:819 start_codon:yes stop_codon:yes gene_type:complete